MRKWREAAAILLGVVIFIVITYGAGELLLPVRINCGATWDRYHQEERSSLDVLYFGSSVVYCDVIPAVVWKETGLTSYVMAGPEQTLPITYHYLRQACKTQSPQAIVVELNTLFSPQYPKTMKPNLLYMPWGAERVLATFCGTAPENRLEMLFPLYGSHDRIYSVTREELLQRLFPHADEYAGATPLLEATPLSQRVDWNFGTEEFFREGIGYLRKISDFCTERQIQLVFYFAPSFCDYPQVQLDALRQALDTIPHALLFDCNDESWPIFDPQASWFDCLHLNLTGAVPFSRRLAQELQTLELPPSQGNEALWSSRYDAVCALLSDAA